MKYASVSKSVSFLAAGLITLAALALNPQSLAATPAAQRASQAAMLTSAPRTDSYRVEQRAEYRLALKDLSKNRISDFKRRQKALSDYTLAPYLEYRYLNKKIDTLSSAQIAEFSNRFSDYPFADRLRDRWLLRLPAQGRWSDYLKNYRPSTSTTRRCYYLRALYRSGERKSALDQVEPLWVHGKSQPKACDSLFKTWIDAGYLSDQIVWARLILAINKNEVSLAKYLRTLIKSETLAVSARALYEAHVRPQTKFNPRAHTADTQVNRAILSAGLKRLARKDPEAALKTWGTVSTSHTFEPEVRKDIESRLLIEAAQEELFPTQLTQLETLSDSTLERVAREAVRQQNWSEASRLIARMSPETKAESEWTYWQARSLGENLEQLAGERNYYGFLAARDEGLETRLHHQPTPIQQVELQQVSKLPGIDRALELYAVDDLLNARREWRAAFATLTEPQRVAAARLAHQYGWLDQSIIAANAASLHNDLDLRFPQVFETHYSKASLATNIPPSTLLAVTRQESAFAHRARSTADARGLMQLLPATAKRTAKKAGLRQPTTLDLYEPAINIRIASEYLANLMTRYNQQRPLAFAAYNAGEHRVDRWIKDRKGMPMEVWIETIPFRETRGYVKSVLAFNHLYSKRLNDPLPLLLPHERTVN